MKFALQHVDQTGPPYDLVNSASPRALGDHITAQFYVYVDDVDAHHVRARAAGARIIAGPADQGYGDRTYRCRDPEGHIWTVGQTVQAVSREEAERVSGLKIDGWV